MTSHLGNFDLLKAERKSRGWSQAKVAEALGVDVATVRRWEAGQVTPHTYHRRKICALFAITPQQLGLLPDTDGQRKAPPTGAGSEPAAETFLLAKPVITEPPDTAESPLPPYGLLKPIKQPLFPPSLWHGGLACIK